MLDDKCNIEANPKDAKKVAAAEGEKLKVTKKLELVHQEEAL